MAKTSLEPSVFLNHARYLKEALYIIYLLPILFNLFSPSQYSKLVLFLNAYHIIKSNGRPASVNGTPLKHHNSKLPSQKGTPISTLRSAESETNQHYELDDIAKKLEQVSHKLGRPISGHFPVPLESDDANSDFPLIQLIRNDPVNSLNRLPAALQELCIIEDLLFLVLVLFKFKLVYVLHLLLES
jgi:hypothetical protein